MLAKYNGKCLGWGLVCLSHVRQGKNFVQDRRKRRKETRKVEKKTGRQQRLCVWDVPGTLDYLPRPSSVALHKFIKESVSGYCLWNLVEALELCVCFDLEQHKHKWRK